MAAALNVSAQGAQTAPVCAECWQPAAVNAARKKPCRALGKPRHACIWPRRSARSAQNRAHKLPRPLAPVAIDVPSAPGTLTQVPLVGGTVGPTRPPQVPGLLCSQNCAQGQVDFIERHRANWRTGHSLAHTMSPSLLAVSYPDTAPAQSVPNKVPGRCAPGVASAGCPAPTQESDHCGVRLASR